MSVRFCFWVIPGTINLLCDKSFFLQCIKFYEIMESMGRFMSSSWLIISSTSSRLMNGSYKWIIMLKKCGRPDLTVFHLIWIIGIYGNWKNQNPGAVLELPAKQHCQSSPFTSEVGPNGLNWQCCLAGSSKTAPRILIFSITMGAKPSF